MLLQDLGMLVYSSGHTINCPYGASEICCTCFTSFQLFSWRLLLIWELRIDFFFFTYLVFLSETSIIVYLLSVLNKCWWNSCMSNLDFQNSRDNWINIVKREIVMLKWLLSTGNPNHKRWWRSLFRRLVSQGWPTLCTSGSEIGYPQGQLCMSQVLEREIKAYCFWKFPQ